MIMTYHNDDVFPSGDEKLFRITFTGPNIVGEGSIEVVTPSRDHAFMLLGDLIGGEVELNQITVVSVEETPAHVDTV